MLSLTPTVTAARDRPGGFSHAVSDHGASRARTGALAGVYRTSAVALSGAWGLSGQAAAAAREWTRSADRGEGRSETGRAESLEIASVLLGSGENAGHRRLRRSVLE